LNPSATAGRDRSAAAPALLFQHIPKTAGTSLRSALEALYPPSARLYLYDRPDLDRAVDPREFWSLPQQALEPVRFVMGHFQYGIHRALPGPARYVTMLREPVDRVASLFYHFKLLAQPRPGSKGFAERERIANAELSFEGWVFEGRQLQADNGMVRQISARKGVGFGRCTDDMLAEALAHIDESYDAVLMRGSMTQSVEILARLVGRPLPPIERRNVNPGRAPLTSIHPEVRERVRELNRLDAELFRSMTERFPATYARIVR
jgi:hypothetical protein